MTVFFFTIISTVLWMFVVFHETPPFSFFIVEDFQLFTFLGGISIVSAIWGYRHPRQKMPYLLLLQVAPLCDLVIRRGVFLVAGIVMGLCASVTSYAMGRGIARCVSALRTENLSESKLAGMLKTGLPLIITSVFLGLAPIFGKEMPLHCPVRIVEIVVGFVTLWGMDIASAAWGFRHSWEKMLFVCILPLGPFCLMMIMEPGPIWIFVLLDSLQVCLVSYMIGRWLAWILRRNKDKKPKHNEDMETQNGK